ncbi:MAG: EAL domain-containing protein [Pseudomonadota bacterium]
MKSEQAQLEAQQLIQDRIARNAPLDAILASIAQMVERYLPDARVTIMLYDPDQNTLSLVEGQGFSETYHEAMQGLEIGPDVGTCGVAAFKRELVITEDVEEDPNWEGYRDLARGEGIVACWSMPIVSSDGELLGTFATYYSQARMPTADERWHINRASGLAALAIARQRNDKALRLNQQRYKSLFTHHPDAIYELDLQGHFVASNQALETISGFSEEQLAGLHYSRFVLPEDQARTNKAFARVCEGQPQNYELAATNAYGEQVVFDVTNLPIIIDGSVVGVYGVGRDITRRRRNEEELRMLKRGVEASTSGIVMVDVQADDMPLVYVNPAFCNITGYSSHEVLGRNCRLLQGEGTCRDSIEKIRQALRDRHETQVVLRNYRKDGTPFWNQLTLAPVFDDSDHCTHYVGIQEDITRQRESEYQLLRQTTHDMLTGLPNRLSFERRMIDDHRFSSQHSAGVAVLFIDLDGFKPINDGLGHRVGDLLLVAVARRLEELVQPGELLSRFEADDFALLMPDAGDEGRIVERAERILGALTYPFEVADREIHISASIGIAAIDGPVQHAAQAIQQAEVAVKEAKEQGRNCWHWFGEDFSVTTEAYVEVRRNIHNGIDKEEFVLHYQPLVNADDHAIHTVEALIRWVRPEEGMISPGEFIPVAEKTGQIVSIGRWALQRACADLVAMNRQSGREWRVAVNISPLQFRRAGFFGELEQALERSGLRPDLLELEVTEGVLMSGTEKTIGLLRDIRALGVGVAIDDFGTGYSSLSYLRNLPINKVKLDRSFVGDIARSEKSAAIVEGVINIAHNLDLGVVAEGVETAEQGESLRAKHCDWLQGFYFARPQSVEDLLALPDPLKPR